MTSLEDLFTQDDDGGRERGGLARGVRRGLLTAMVSAALAGGLVLALDLVGYHVAYPLAFGGFLALAVLFQAVRALRVARPGRLGGRPAAPVDDPAPDGLASEVTRWQARLTGDGPAGAALAELVDARLWRRRGITSGSDPVRARQLLGGRLWTYLVEGSRTPPAKDLATMLTTVERL